MTTLLQTNAFHRIPPANIQAIFQRLQRMPCRAGEVVIKQGDEGDYFYIIVQGKCAVTRETPLSREGIKLAELGVGDTFGEEALIAEAKRNATVTMLTDGVLMRLNKQDFRELMNEPLLQWVSHEQAREIIERGGRWLDVRLPSEHQNLRHRGRAQRAALPDPPEALDARSRTSPTSCTATPAGAAPRRPTSWSSAASMPTCCAADLRAATCSCAARRSE